MKRRGDGTGALRPVDLVSGIRRAVAAGLLALVFSSSLVACGGDGDRPSGERNDKRAPPSNAATSDPGATRDEGVRTAPEDADVASAPATRTEYTRHLRGVVFCAMVELYAYSDPAWDIENSADDRRKMMKALGRLGTNGLRRLEAIEPPQELREAHDLYVAEMKHSARFGQVASDASDEELMSKSDDELGLEGQSGEAQTVFEAQGVQFSPSRHSIDGSLMDSECRKASKSEPLTRQLTAEFVK